MPSLPTGALSDPSLLSLGVAFILSLLLTPLVRVAAGRLTARADSATFDSIPALGGLAFVPATFAALLIYPPSLPLGFSVIVAEAALIGVVDDLRPLSPRLKTVLLILASATGWFLGLRFGLDLAWLDLILTVAWLTWFANAFNVVDMEDGLSTGLAVLACVGFLAVGWGSGLPVLKSPAVALAGGLLGFLYYNAYPARIYMGDTGSLFVGFFLAGLAIVTVAALPAPAGVAAPLLILAVPNYEALFLVFVRTAKCRAPWLSSRDHTTQRLVVYGLPVRGSVILMYGAGALTATAGAAVLLVDEALLWGIVGVVAMAAAASGGVLSRVDMEGDGVDGRPLSVFAKNWLIYGLMQSAMGSVRDTVSGRLLDVGCGRRPYATVFADAVTDYVGLERDRRRYADAPADVCGDTNALPFEEDCFDTVLSNQVLEHVPEPAYAVVEMARVVKPGGRLVLTAPHIWGLHEEPHDYFRFTPYGLAYMVRRAGLEVERLEALAGYWVTAGARFCYYLGRFARGPLKVPVAGVWCVVQCLAFWLDSLHRDENDAWNHLVVARKRIPGENETRP